MNKTITLQGQTSCTGRAATLTCTDGTTIYDGTGTGYMEIPIEISASNVRLTGFTFLDTRTVSDSKCAVQTDPGTTGWRIDHSRFHPTNTNNTRAITAYGYGLVDHVYFQDAQDGVDIEGGQSSDPVYPGDASWATSMSLGTAQAIYVEDNEFKYTLSLDGAYDAYCGARLVFRFNDVQGINFGSHGLDSGGCRSVLQQEIYGNTISNAGSAIYTVANTRGGTTMLFNNTVSASGGSFNSLYWIQNYRSDPSCAATGECGSWGTCNGTNSIDQNATAGLGYGCRDQPGRGAETAAASDWPTKTTSLTFSEALYPIYAWGNSFKGATPTASSYYLTGYQEGTEATTYHILYNRDVFVEAASFDGRSGTGTGLFSARPATCTTGVAYWATDQNTLYKCAANTWSSYYVPYAYPHPLQGVSSGKPIAPAGVVAIAK